MENFCVGDIIKLKINSQLNKSYYFSKRNNQAFVILNLSVSSHISNIDKEPETFYNLKLMSLMDVLRFEKRKQNRINIQTLPSYTSKNFYKIDRRLILEKKEDYFINKIMSR